MKILWKINAKRFKILLRKICLMILTTNIRSYVTWSLVCISVVACAGCFTYYGAPALSLIIPYPTVELDPKNAIRKDRGKYLAIVNDYKNEADKGDLASMTLLALEYFDPEGAFGYDVQKGVSLLERAAAKQYGVAEYALGLILLNRPLRPGHNPPDFYSIPNPDVMPESERGMELLKRAASHACHYDIPMPLIDLGDPISYIIYQYNSGSKIPKDIEQANLWRARDLIHCNHYDGIPDDGYLIMLVIFPAIRDAASDEDRKAIIQAAMPEQQTEALAWAQLLSERAEYKSALISWLIHADRTEAERRTMELRRAVAESEREYSPPSQREFNIHLRKNVPNNN
jgi:hypothetical protein